jgi:hypothetical protein
MRGQGPTDRTPPAGITKRVASLARPVAQILRCAAPGVYTFTDSGPGSGLDLSARMFAPCLLGRPGTGRQDAVLTSLRLAGLRYSSACHSIPVTQVFKKVPLNSGLLIRGFGVQVPGNAPGMTWGFITSGHFYVSVLSRRLLRICSRAQAPQSGACQERPIPVPTPHLCSARPMV